MMTIPFQPELFIASRIRLATSMLEDFEADFDPDVRPADPRFGDFQSNGVLPYAKRMRRNPRELAQGLLEALQGDEEIGQFGIECSVAGPGFINFRFPADFLIDWLRTYADADSLGRGASGLYRGRKVVVDFSGPNSAKQMHVGHIRSTVIGEAISRLTAFCGAEVIRDNHIGDWGTQFGILLLALKRRGGMLPPEGDAALVALEELYREGTRLCESDPACREEARAELVRLQNGDPASLELWETINQSSYSAFERIYDRLGVRFDLVLGESFYRDKVEQVYRELTEQDIAQESEGALVVFHAEHPRFATQPFIVRKSDGASNYATTDLATVLYRTETLGAGEIIVVTDGRQQDHFAQLFLTVEKWFARTGRKLPHLRHVWFGTILGEDHKAIKTRSGESLKLKDLLDEAVRRAQAIVEEKNPELSAAEKARVAEVVGLGAVRYGDLQQNRTQDYLFSWEKMLAFDGNTAPYLLYAVARLHGIFRKAGIVPGEGEEGSTAFETPGEIELARKLLGFPHALGQTLQDLRPHFLCTYLFELSATFSAFYSVDRVMHEDEAIRARRLILASRTLTILETGLHLLGLETLERM